MSTSWIDGGVDAVCPSCGKKHHVLRPWCYAWKLNATVTPGVQKMLYCCSYTCWRKYQKDYEEIKRKRRSDAAYRRHGTKPKEDHDGGTG